MQLYQYYTKYTFLIGSQNSPLFLSDEKRDGENKKRQTWKRKKQVMGDVMSPIVLVSPGSFPSLPLPFQVFFPFDWRLDRQTHMNQGNGIFRSVPCFLLTCFNTKGGKTELRVKK